MEKKFLAIIVFVLIASLSIAGCTSSTSTNQAASRAPQAALTTANTTTSASASATPSATRTPTSSSTPTATPTPSYVAPTAVLTPTATPSPTVTPTATPITSKKSTTLSFLAEPLQTTEGQPDTVVWGIAANGKGVPGLKVDFYISEGQKYVGSATSGADGTGTFTFQTTGYSLGPHSTTAIFSGNAQYDSSLATGGFYLV